MGFFSDTCEAYVDEKGFALTGEALLAAQRNPHATRCGNKNKKAAKGCSKCGSATAKGWVKCRGCRKWNDPRANFCGKCRKPLHPEDRGSVADGVWHRPGYLLASRIDVGDILDQLQRKKKLVVEEGTKAILLQEGALRDLMEPGEHTLSSLAHRINHWGSPPPRTLVLIDSGDIALPIRIDDLHSAEDIPVELYAEIHVRLAGDKKAAGEFLSNIMKDARELSYDGFSATFSQEVRYAATNITNTSTIEDLFKNPNRRLEVEDALQRTLKDCSQRYGFELVRVSAVEFSGAAYEKLRQQNGDFDVSRRQLEFDQRLREMLQKDQLKQFKDENELQEYVDQLAQEKDITAEHRDQELALLRMVQRQELTSKDAQFAQSQEMEKTAHDIQVKMEWDEYDRSKDYKDEEAEAETTRIWLKVKEEKAMLRLSIQREEEQLRLDSLAQEMNLYEGKDLQTLLASPQLGEEQRKSLMEFNEQQLMRGMDSSEILASAATKNPEIVRLLLEQETAKSSDRDEEWEERKKLMDEAADRLERIMTKALETTSDAAKNAGPNPGPTNNIIK